MATSFTKKVHAHLSRAKAFWDRHKETFSLVASAGALALSAITYFATVWRAHELQAFVRTSIVEGEKYPIKVLLSNVGQHTEVVLTVDINAGTCDEKTIARQTHAGASPVLIVPKASYSIAEISVSPRSLVQDANEFYKQSGIGTERTIRPLLIVEYLAPDGIPKQFCEPIGEFEFADASALFAAVKIEGTRKAVRVLRQAALP